MNGRCFWVRVFVRLRGHECGCGGWVGWWVGGGWAGGRDRA
jgi:hypothetical protein